MIKKISFSILILLLFSFSYYNNFRELVIEKLSNYNQNGPEKIYIQTDKPYYAIGDNIWLSAYLLNGITHKSSLTSNVVYVELINAKDSIVDKKQLLVTDINTAGDFKIRNNWQPGTYTLRAYTNYMRNDSPDYFFSKEIPVVNVTPNSTVATRKISTNTSTNTDAVINKIPDIGFYPESGYLVNNIPSKTAIKVKGTFKDSKIKGVIKNSKNEIVTTFETYKFGLGIINFVPKHNENYYASIKINNKDVKYPFPKVLPEGYNLEVANHGNQIHVKVASSRSKSLKNTLLIAHQRGKLVYEHLQTIDTTSYKIKIDTKFLTDGITNFTLFDNEGKPICERLVFTENSENNVSIDVVLNKTQPTTRDKVSLSIAIKDKTKRPVFGNLSFAITDVDAIAQNTNTENIKTYLLLNSDLRGHIENPGYYFQKENDPRRRFLLDLVMLTHGWRRFTWEKLLYDKPQKQLDFNAEKGIYISGHTTDLKGLKQQISAATRLSFMSDNIHQESQQSNTKGKFSYGPYIFNDTIHTILEARVKDFQSDKDKTNRFVDIHLDNQLKDSPEINTKKLIENVTIDSIRLKNYIKKTEQRLKVTSEFSKEGTVLDEIVIVAESRTKEEARTEELKKRTPFYNNPTYRLDMAELEDQRVYNIIDLINQMPGVRAINETISIRNQGAPVILVDGQVVDIIDILFLTGEDVDFIDILDGPKAAFIPNASNGAVAIYSRTGSFTSSTNVKRKPGILNFTVNGFYTAREFYAPNYSDEFEVFNGYKDLRTTLHWEPKVMLTPQLPTANISFFTGDIKSNYAIKIEGITNDGVPFYHFSTFEVK